MDNKARKIPVIIIVTLITLSMMFASIAFYFGTLSYGKIVFEYKKGQAEQLRDEGDYNGCIQEYTEAIDSGLEYASEAEDAGFYGDVAATCDEVADTCEAYAEELIEEETGVDFSDADMEDMFSLAEEESTLTSDQIDGLFDETKIEISDDVMEELNDILEVRYDSIETKADCLEKKEELEEEADAEDVMDEEEVDEVDSQSKQDTEDSFEEDDEVSHEEKSTSVKSETAKEYSEESRYGHPLTYVGGDKTTSGKASSTADPERTGAYVEALQSIVDSGSIEINGKNTSVSKSGNQFTIIDIDSDGHNELLISQTGSGSDAPVVYAILDYRNGVLRNQASVSLGSTYFYKNKALRSENASRHTYSNSNSYSILIYSESTDSYIWKGSVEIWDQSVHKSGFQTEVDKDKDGRIYRINTVREFGTDEEELLILDKTGFTNWRRQFVKQQEEELKIVWSPLTQESVNQFISSYNKQFSVNLTDDSQEMDDFEETESGSTTGTSCEEDSDVINDIRDGESDSQAGQIDCEL